jgi:hypothetical protein
VHASGMPGSESTSWTLVQPSVRRRVWELRRGDETVASLELPVFRSTAHAETPEQRLRIARERGVRAAYAVFDDLDGSELARLRAERGRRVLELDDVVAEWKNLRRGRGFGFVDPEGVPLLTAKVRTGLLRSSGELEIDSRLSERQATVAALLACYLLIRRNEQAASGAAGASAATAGA